MCHVYYNTFTHQTPPVCHRFHGFHLCWRSDPFARFRALAWRLGPGRDVTSCLLSLLSFAHTRVTQKAGQREETAPPISAGARVISLNANDTGSFSNRFSTLSSPPLQFPCGLASFSKPLRPSASAFLRPFSPLASQSPAER